MSQFMSLVSKVASLTLFILLALSVARECVKKSGSAKSQHFGDMVGKAFSNAQFYGWLSA